MGADGASLRKAVGPSCHLLAPAALRGLSPEQEVFLTHLCELSVDVKAVRDLAHIFQKMVRERHAEV